MATNVRKPQSLPYGEWAGKNEIASAPLDDYGNPLGEEYDLIPDGSMQGYSIHIFDFSGKGAICYEKAIAALEKKGFKVIYTSGFPADLEASLQKASQVWIFSGRDRSITPKQVALLKSFYEAGHGLYLWADYGSWSKDVNVLAQELFATSIDGSYERGKTLGLQSSDGATGIVKGNLLTTGLARFYEGSRIAHIRIARKGFLTSITKAFKKTEDIKPLIVADDGSAIVAYADGQERRCVLDGSYSRLTSEQWEKAGVERYVVNAAAWLANLERFGYKRKASRKPQAETDKTEKTEEGVLPYGKWAGRSEIPGAPLDPAGNPLGEEYDLIPDGSMKGYSILIADFYGVCTRENCKEIVSETTRLLEKKGFKVIWKDGLPENLATVLRSVSQVWILSEYCKSDKITGLTNDQIAKLKKFYEEGHGLFILGGYGYYGSHVLLDELFAGCRMGGISVTSHKLGLYKETGEAGKVGAGAQDEVPVGVVANHLLTTGITYLTTSSNMSLIFFTNVAGPSDYEMKNGLKALVYEDSRLDRSYIKHAEVSTAYCDQQARRCLIDGGGIGKLFMIPLKPTSSNARHYYDASAGQGRFLVNAAAWLANLERFGYKRR